MQAAAMWRVERIGLVVLALESSACEADIRATFRAMPVQYVDAALHGEPGNSAIILPVGEVDIAAHLQPRYAERAGVSQSAQSSRGLLSTRACITDDADIEPEPGLTPRQIVHVAKQASDRRSQAMQDANLETPRGGPEWPQNRA